ncbi:MAG: strawberry notch family protein, partial [Sedimentisphaerales bacterium]
RSGGYQIVVFDPSLLKIESIVEDTDLSGVELAERKIESEIQAAPAAAKGEKPKSAENDLINSIIDHLEDGKSLDAKTFFGLADKAYGGTRAEGAYGPSDAYDVLETAINKYIKDSAKGLNPSAPYGEAVEHAKWIDSELLDRLPSQTNRSGEKELMQQFSTPPHYSYAVAWAANIGENDIVLEPSAGTGSLVVHAINAGPKAVYANELSERRAMLLRTLGVDKVFTEDAEQIHNILPEENRPTVILMNPPFSHAAHRMGAKKVYGTDLKHIDAALNYLQDGGRLVAIMGRPRIEGEESATFQRWVKEAGKKYDVRANVHVGRKVYKKYGTQFPTRILIIDKTGPQKGEILGGTVDTIPDLMYHIEGVRNDRIKAKPEEVGAGRKEAVGRREAGARPTIPIQPSTPTVVTGKVRADRPLGETPGRVPGEGKEDVGVEPGPRAEGVVERLPGRREGAEKREQVRDVAPGESGRELESKLKSENIKQRKKTKNKLSENVFESYEPSRFHLTGAKSHPAALVESTAMAAVSAPDITYEMSLPQKVVDKGLLSDVQLEVIAYAGQSHEQKLPKDAKGVEYRRGFFIGDGTGVGKGREISGIILDNWNKGRKKALWISVSKDLLKDAMRDWGKAGIGQDETLIFPFKSGQLKAKQGIMYATYDTLKWSRKATGRMIGGELVTQQEAKNNLDAIVEWLGKDF